MTRNPLILSAIAGLTLALLLGVGVLGRSVFTGITSPADNFQLLAEVSSNLSPGTGTAVSAPAPASKSTPKPTKKAPAEQSANEPAPTAVSLVTNESTNSIVPVPPPPQECRYTTNMFPNYRNVVMNEVAWMGTTASANGEWIELKNISQSAVDIGGWQVIDKGEQITVMIPVDTKLSPGAFFMLERGQDALPTPAGVVYTGALANTDEGLRLFDNNCFLIDEVLANPDWLAGDGTARKTMERGEGMRWHTSSAVGGSPNSNNSIPPVATASTQPPTDSTSSPQASSTPTEQPTLAPEPTSTPPVSDPEPSSTPPTPGINHLVITEVMAGSDASGDYEFVELYNPTGSTIDLTGWSVKKKTSSGSESSLVVASRFEGKSIPPGKHFLLGHDVSYTGPTADVVWPGSYSLAYTNNAVVVYDGAGSVVDQVAWENIPKNTSYERAPVDGAQWSPQVTPNPQNSSQ